MVQRRNILLDNTETGYNGDATEVLGERDKAFLQIFTVLIVSVSVAYTIAYGNAYVALNGIIALVVTYSFVQSTPRPFLSEMHRFANPVEEAAIAISIYFSYAWVIHPLTDQYGLIVQSLLLLCFGIAPTIIILVKGCGYSPHTLGLIREVPKESRSLFKVIILGLLISFGLRMVPYLSRLPNLLSGKTFYEFLNLAVFVGILIGFAEELVYRCIVQPRISQQYRSRIVGLLVTSSLFALFHVVAVTVGLESPTGGLVAAFFYALLTRLALAILMGIMWISSENLFLVWPIHSLNNIFYAMLLLLS